MEILVGYFLGAIVLVLFVISLFKMVSSRINDSKSEMKDRITFLEEPIEELENK